MEAERERKIVQALGHAIAHERAKAGYTQDQVAEALGIGSEAVSRMERGTAVPTVPRLVELGELFKCPVEHFLRKASDSKLDNAQLLEALTSGLDSTDRKLITDITELLSKHLKSRDK